MLAGTLLDFDRQVAKVVADSLTEEPSLVNYAIDDDGSFPYWATTRSREQLEKLLLSSTDKQVEPEVYEVIDNFLVGSIGLAEALWRLRVLTLPLGIRQFAVSWQAKLNIYMLSRAGKLTPAQSN